MKLAKPTWLMLPVLMFAVHSFSQSTFKIQANTTLDLNGGVVLTLVDFDLDNDGTLSPAAGAGRIIFKGAANSTIRGNGITNFDELEIAKTGNRSVLFQTNSDIRSGVWFSSGLLHLDNRAMTLVGNATLNGESESSRITTANGGYVQVSMLLNGPRAVNPGNLGAIITSSQNLGLTSIRRGHEAQTVEGGRSSILRYFEITPQFNTALNATFRIQYADAELNNQAEGAIEFRLSEGGGKWIKRSSSSRNTSSNYIELQGLNSFSTITLADDGAGLPVLFKSFTVECGNNETLLTWITASEQNARHFEVQRSANGTVWTTIATLPAAGNSSTDKRYSYTDQNPQGKYYRIREVDLDGQHQLSTVGLADCETSYAFKSWPNPVQDQLWISVKAVRNGNAAINIYSTEGKLVKKQNNGLMAGTNRLAVDMLALPKGLYHVEVIWNDDIRKRITVVKR